MRSVYRTTQFKKDLKLASKRRKDLSKLASIMTKLTHEETLDIKFKDHQLTGNYKDHRECHIEPDWLLIYRETDEAIIFVRTGTHSDLFQK